MPPSSLRVVYAFAREMHPKTTDVFIQYGTAGFRTKASLLEHVVYRMGLLAVIRSRCKNGRTIGIMITASHNLEPDNGVKLIDPDGEMLEQDWEEIATRLANVRILISQDTDKPGYLLITASHNLEPDNGVKLIDPDGEMLEQDWEEIATRLANVRTRQRSLSLFVWDTESFNDPMNPGIRVFQPENGVKLINPDENGVKLIDPDGEMLEQDWEEIATRLANVRILITASHNLEPNNGVKLIDPGGEMLEQDWEEIATRLANVSDNDLESTTEQIIKEVNADMTLKASVFIGMDTRYTSPRLAAAAVHGVMALKGTAKEFGIVTTPMLHYCVKCRNDSSYGTPSEEGYYEKIVGAFKKIRQNLPVFGNYSTTLYIDGANGVGGKKLNIIKKTLDGELDLVLYNIGGNGGKLNLNCGADFVKVSQKPPVGVEHAPNQRVASLDGDGDRLVYYFLDDNNKMHLLDGDRIATLLASYITELLKSCAAPDLTMGLVQTAYANGASTQYITERLKVPVTCVKTGVKHLHHAALSYDIGIYFEANGHGTVVYSQRAKDTIRKIAEEGEPEQRKAALLLLNFIDMTNETVGDAISDLFLVETVLCARGHNASQWLAAYDDLPCRQLKVTVKDRNAISTTDAERKCTAPEGLQTKIDELVAQYKHGRAFVRPSGTEDVVRVYAEADTQENAEKLSAQVAAAVFDLAGGEGERPAIPA
ncbi:phosphoglucomutase/phosphomannomutase, alpha/beta/alpha domain I domain-containing protein [Phthorimaea operculella]|nr:phosphoglucomutase/phosphomannomutase, alpha/beta/alpha domain I domain-containing protein [Phthorimaea operculella]